MSIYRQVAELLYVQPRTYCLLCVSSFWQVSMMAASWSQPLLPPSCLSIRTHLWRPHKK